MEPTFFSQMIIQCIFFFYVAKISYFCTAKMGDNQHPVFAKHCQARKPAVDLRKKEEYIDLTINSMDVSGAKNAVGRHVELAPFAKKERCGRL